MTKETVELEKELIRTLKEYWKVESETTQKAMDILNQTITELKEIIN